jgi:aminoglycoside/choline kinase family phosphotransferase
MRALVVVDGAPGANRDNNALTETREQALRAWALERLPGDAAAEWLPVAGDASTRRYFRLRRGAESRIAMDAPPATEKNAAFRQVRGLLEADGLRVPAEFAVDLERGFMLLGDLGDRLLLDALSAESAPRLYRRALDTLHAVQAVAADQLPGYTDAVLREELGRFPEWFCDGLLGRPLGGDVALFDDLVDQLVATALAQPSVFVHRDFHSRNLLLQDDGGLGVIDFQDALRGPLCYDPVSLLKDCYLRWPRDQVLDWLAYYHGGLEPRPDWSTMLRWFDWLGLQRHLKVLGNFARLAVRDDRPRYLDDLPLVVDYIRETLDLYPEFAPFRDWLAAELEPLIARQPWSAPA